MTKKHDIIWLETVDSTNNEVRRRISDIDNLSVLAAVRQTAGRGQRGNSWISGEGENLTFSVALKFEEGEFPACRQFDISMITALAVTELLKHYGVSSSVKWPNDIYVGDRKICGILIENSLREKWLFTSIIGIGLNINQQNFNVSLINPTSVVIENTEIRQIDLNEALVKYMDYFTDLYHRYQSGKSAEIRDSFLSKLWRKDASYEFIDTRENIRFYGKIRGINNIGMLIIENNEGELMEFAFKEISYII